MKKLKIYLFFNFQLVFMRNNFLYANESIAMKSLETR